MNLTKVSLQRSMFQLLASAVAFSFLAFAPRPAHALAHAFKGIQANVLFTYTEYQTAGVSYTYEAIGEAGVDPVMHLMGSIGGGVWDSEIRYSDDDAGGLNSRIVYTAGSSRWVTVVVRSYSQSSQGTGTFKRCTGVGCTPTALVTGASFRGEHIYVPSDANDFFTALSPLGTNDTVLLALDSTGHAIRGDDDYGVGLASRTTILSAANRVVVGAYSVPGPTNFYANDLGLYSSNDYDGDQLGLQLETELGTCDRSDQAGCADVYNLADSDRDGVQDTFEVMGKDDANAPQHLAKWGADPRRKDIFIEADWRSLNNGDTRGFPSSQVTNPLHVYRNLSDAGCTPPATGCKLVAELVSDSFLEAPAADIRNRAGLDSIAVHFDVGIDNTASTLQPWGNFGGSSMIDLLGCASPVGGVCPGLSDVRRGIFRHLSINSANGGVSGIPSWFYDSNVSRIVVTHETGHSANLQHYGHSTAGVDDCKPNYRSIMSYAFQAVPGQGFSLGANTNAQQNANLFEVSPNLPGWSGYLANAPFVHVMSGSSVDWNRGGTISDDSNSGVRAPGTMPTVINSPGCNASAAVADIVTIGNTANRTPDIVRVGSKLVAFFIGSDNKPYFSTANFGPAPHSGGSCTGTSDGSVGLACNSWTTPTLVPVTDTATGVSAIEWGSKVVVAYRSAVSTKIRVLAADPDGATFSNWSSDPEISDATDANTDVELSWQYVNTAPVGGQAYGASKVMTIFYAESGIHRYQWRRAVADTWSTAVPVLDDSGNSLAATQTAAVTPWPNPGATWNWDSEPTAGACGLFPDNLRRARLYCYDRASDRWTDLSARFAGSVPLTRSKPSIAAHALRAGNGNILPGGNSLSQLWMITADAVDTMGNPIPARPVVHTTTELSTAAAPLTTAFGVTTYPVASNTVNFTVAVGASVPLFEDGQVVGLKALRVIAGQGTTLIVQSLPLFDGSYRIPGGMKDVNDFRIMERGICLGVRSGAQPADGAAFCGGSDTNPWGF